MIFFLLRKEARLALNFDNYGTNVFQSTVLSSLCRYPKGDCLMVVLYQAVSLGMPAKAALIQYIYTIMYSLKHDHVLNANLSWLAEINH